MKPINVLFFAVCATGTVSGISEATVLRVDAAATCVPGSNCANPACGGAWATAYQDLQDAIDCAVAGDEIWVVAGTYGPIELKSGIKLYGGFAGTETAASQSDPAINVTTIDGAEGHAVEAFDCDENTVFRGFRVTNGFGVGYSDGGALDTGINRA